MVAGSLNLEDNVNIKQANKVAQAAYDEKPGTCYAMKVVLSVWQIVHTLPRHTAIDPVEPGRPAGNPCPTCPPFNSSTSNEHCRQHLSLCVDYAKLLGNISTRYVH